MTTRAASKGATTLSAFDLTLDKVGNPTRIVEQTGEPGQPTITESTAFTYDAANRLIERLSPEVQLDGARERVSTRFAYDAANNLIATTRAAGTAEASTEYSYYDANNRRIALVISSTSWNRSSPSRRARNAITSSGSSRNR